MWASEAPDTYINRYRGMCGVRSKNNLNRGKASTLRCRVGIRSSCVRTTLQRPTVRETVHNKKVLGIRLA